ncbi:hypothetical protein ABIE56_003911 [Luteibacter sp. 621]|uniref:hypothetical protein n=1 Tax=Luteibacter sp. 621 TaxID=3373916 RepID=UPI003D19D4CF
MILRKLALLLSLAISYTSPAFAQSAESKGQGSVTYGWHLSADDRQTALHKAKVNAVERYIADTNAARSRVFDQQRERIEAHIDDYVLGATVLSEDDAKSSKTYSTVVRADINSTRLLNDLGGGSANAAAVSSTNHQTLTFLFMSRSQASVQSFDAKVYKRADADTSYKKTTHEGESVRASSVGTSDGVDEHASVAMTTGGSTTRKADKVDWAVTQSGDINTAMTGIFADAGYDVVEADQVEGASNGLLSIARIRDAYSHGDDLPSQMTRDATQGVQQAGIGLLALGTLDVGMQDTDPVSGNTRVYVTVTGKVYNVSGRFARTLSSVGPVQFAGLGPDASVARTNALKLASQKAAQQMVDELNNKGIH